MLPLLLILIQCVLTHLVQSDCRIDPLKIQPSPLILDRNREIIYPNSRSHVATIKKHDEILIACPGNHILLHDVPVDECMTAQCVDKETFIYGVKEFNYYSLRCQDIPNDSIKYTGRSCPEGGDEIEIGFDIAPGVFLRQMRICFDNTNFTPIFSHYNLTSNIGYRDGRVPRKFFEEDGFYSTSQNIDDLYRRNNERKTINDQLDLESNSNKYIKESGELFINRGHLTAKGDFVYASQQLATFHYVNSAPQWASFNGGNWNELEISLRNYADSLPESTLEVYTGVEGISSLRNNRTGKTTDLFLHTTNARYLLPIPQLFWKMIYDTNNDRGVVVVGVNNAYEVNIAEDVVCNDISDKISWFNNKLQAQKHNIDLGYIYACSIPEFRRKVVRTPVLNGRQLLL